MPGAVQDVIMPANFCEDRLRGFGVARGRISLFRWLASSPLKHSRTTVRVCDPTGLCHNLRFYAIHRPVIPAIYFITHRATERGVQAVHCTGAQDHKRGPWKHVGERKPNWWWGGANCDLYGTSCTGDFLTSGRPWSHKMFIAFISRARA